MSHLRILICRVEDEAKPEEMTELHRLDLPAADLENLKPETTLDQLEERSLEAGQLIMRRLLEYQWVDTDELLAQAHERAFPPGDGDS